MARTKLDPHVERKRQFDAYVTYRDLGYGRSYRAVARAIQASPQTISKWAQLYNWEERLTQFDTTVAKRKEGGALMKVDDPVVQKLVDAMERVEASIDSAFIHEPNGTLTPTLKIGSVEELVRLIAEYRRFLETYHRFVEAYIPPEKAKDRATNIKEFNVNMGNTSQEERINLMKGLVDANVKQGDSGTTGGIQDADYTEVPGRGDEDRHGCDGVPGSTPDSGGGDKAPV